MTSVSTHGGLVHVGMNDRSLTAEGITSLVRNSPKLIILCLYASRVHVDGNVINFNATLKKMFSERKLFTAGYYSVMRSVFLSLTVIVIFHHSFSKAQIFYHFDRNNDFYMQ